jgi:hypothetical protein
MPDEISIARQEEADREYLRACREHGIEPDLPRYRSEISVMDAEALARFAESVDGASHNGQPLIVPRAPEPLKDLTPEAEGAGKLLDLLMPPAKSDPARFVAAAGRRMLVVAWLLGRRRESLADLGRALNISRASLSAYARRMEDALGVHGRGQKSATTPAMYAANARKSWKLRKLNTAMAEAASPQ